MSNLISSRDTSSVRSPRRLALGAALAALLIGTVAIAFFSGGYFNGPRAWGGLVAWLLVAIAAGLAPRPVPTSGSARLTLGALTLLAGWTLVSFVWSPVAGTAYQDGQRVFLYLGVLIAATILLRGRARDVIEPAVAAATLIIVGYGLSERLLPGLLTFTDDVSAAGRLEQPLTYWNAMGAVGAIGVVLCASLLGQSSRRPGLRIAAATAAAPLGLGTYIAFSRGALFACAAGLIALAVLAPNRSNWRGIGLVLSAAVAGALSGGFFSGVTSLQGSHSQRVSQGMVTLVLLLVISLAAGLLARRFGRRERSGQTETASVRLPRHAGWLAVALVIAGFAIFLVVGAKETSGNPSAGNANRLTSLQSSRYAYWSVAWRAIQAEPVIGIGGGGWALDWLRYRPYHVGAQDAHSLYIQTFAELGLVGVVFLAAFLLGVIQSARLGLRIDRRYAAGSAAGVAVWGTHAAIDWDWEMPGLTLLAILLIGGLLALNEEASSAATPG